MFDFVWCVIRYYLVASVLAADDDGLQRFLLICVFFCWHLITFIMLCRWVISLAKTITKSIAWIIKRFRLEAV